MPQAAGKRKQAHAPKRGVAWLWRRPIRGAPPRDDGQPPGGSRSELGWPLFREAAAGSLYSHAATKLPPHWRDNP